RALQAQAAAHPAVGTDRLPQGGRPAVGGHRGSPIASCVTTPVVGAAVPWSGSARPPSAPELTRGDCRGYLASRVGARAGGCAAPLPEPVAASAAAPRAGAACPRALGLPSQYIPATKTAPPTMLPSVARLRL